MVGALGVGGRTRRGMIGGAAATAGGALGLLALAGWR
jgi:hypothetical protein